MRMAMLMLGAAMLAAGCSREPEPGESGGVVIDNSATAASSTSSTPIAQVPPAVNAPLPTDAWVGKWVGVEGLALEIAKTTAPGNYLVTVTLMDGRDSYDGVAEGDAIRITRGIDGELIRKATGAQTGLKWLADKQDCLMIKSGEGFCRG